MVRSLTGLVLRWPWLVLIGCVVLTGAAATGLRGLVIAGDYEIFFDAGNPHLAAYRALERAFEPDDSIVFVLAPASGDALDSDSLAAVRTLTERAEALPYAIRAASVTHFPYVEASGDALEITELFPGPRELDAADLPARRAYARAEPALVDGLLSSRGHVSGVNVVLHLPGDSPTEYADVVIRARALARETEAAHPGLRVYLTGVAVINHGFAEGAAADILTLSPVMMVILLSTVGLLLRSVAAVVATMGLMGLAVTSAMGIATALGIPVTPPSASASVIVMTIAVANSIHLSSILLARLRAGETREEAITHAMAINAEPILLTSVTTAIGFLCLNTSEIPPYRFLGNTAAIGTLATLVFTFTFVPALFALWPLRPANRAVTSGPWERLGDFVVARRVGLFVGTGLVIVATSLCVFRNEINDDFVGYFAEDMPARVGTEFAMENLTGVFRLNYALGSGAPDGVYEPAYLEDLEAFAVWARAQPEVVHVTVLTDALKRLHWAMNGAVPEAYALPDSRALAAQYLLVYESYGFELAHQIDGDLASSRAILSLANLSNAEVQAFEARVQDWMAATLPDEMRADGTGPMMMFAHIFELGTISTLQGLALAAVLIAGIVAIQMRSVKLGLISLVPNVFPAIMALGVWGLIDGRVNVASSAVAAVSFGIVVDDTIHLLSKYRHARRKLGKSPEDAVRYTLAVVGRAIVATTVVLTVGFSVLTGSSFGLNYIMGLLTGITIGAALLLDLFLLPPILMWLDRPRSEA